jgi:tight adherence protein C
MAVFAAFMAALAVFVAIRTVLAGKRPDAAATRMEQWDRGGRMDREALLGIPFSERVGGPLAQRARHSFSHLLPASMVSNLERRLLVAGEPMSLHALITVQLVCVGLAVVLMFSTISSGATGLRLFATLAFAALLMLLPLYWLRIKTSARKRALLKAFPDAVDLIVTTVEAGLGIDAALYEVGHETRGPLGEELRLAVRETTLGRSRRESLQRLVDRTQVPEIKSFVQSLIQAEQTGIPIGQVLRTQAGQVRLHKRQRAEADAQRAPVKMVVVLAVLVLPSMLLLVMGPAVMRMADAL